MIIALLCAVALFFTSSDVSIFGSALVIPLLCAASVLVALSSVFSYRNRKRQSLLNNLNMLINVLLIGLLATWLLNLPGGIQFPEKGIEPVFPVVALVCLFLANMYIGRDDRLVKSVDRLR